MTPEPSPGEKSHPCSRLPIRSARERPATAPDSRAWPSRFPEPGTGSQAAPVAWTDNPSLGGGGLPGGGGRGGERPALGLHTAGRTAEVGGTGDPAGGRGGNAAAETYTGHFNKTTAVGCRLESHLSSRRPWTRSRNNNTRPFFPPSRRRPRRLASLAGGWGCPRSVLGVPRAH